MKTKLLVPGALFFLACATIQAQIPITTNTLAPALGAYDQYYLPGPVDEATGAMTTTGAANANSGANDVLTYVAFDKASKGQSFTTGPNPAGYTISSVTVRHILWTNFLANGTYMNIPSGQTFDFRFGTMSGTNITAILTTNATYSGSSLSMAGGGGTGIYFTFDLSGAGLNTLSPNTTYFFEIASPATAYFELHNTVTNDTSYTGGTAFYGDATASLDQSGGVNLPPFGGEFAFVAKLAAVGAPSVVATVSPSSASSGQSFTVMATVTPGAGTVTNVSVDLSSIGGPSAAGLVLSSANVYTNTFTVSPSAPIGTATLTVTATDTTPLTGNYGVPFTVLPNNRVWNGGSLVDNNWSTASNWQGGLAPSLSGNNLFFAGATRLTPNMDNSYSVSELVFSNTAGSFAIGSSVGGTLTVGNGGIENDSANTQTLNVPVVLGAAQTINLAAGGLTLNSNAAGGVDLTTIGPGALTLSGAGTTTLGNLRLSSGQLNVTAGTVNVSDASGAQTRIESNATVVVTGGTLNLVGSNVLNGWFPIGVTAGATGAVVVAGGTINVNDHWGTEVGNENGSGVLTVNSGTYVNNDAGGVGLLIADGSSPQGTINLNGGALIANQLGAGSGAGGQFYFNGGTLKPIFSNAGFWNNSTKVTASIRNGGAVVDTAGFNVTIGQPLLHSTVPGDNATDGGLTKIGNGTLTLSGGYSYTGPTRVLGGTLSVNPAPGISATAGDLIVSNAALTVNASSGTNLPAGNLTLAGGTAINLNYGALSADPTNAAIVAAGSLSISGTNVINITGSGLTPGQFPLIAGIGTAVPTNTFRLGSLPAGVLAVLTNNAVNSSLDLLVTAVGNVITWVGVDTHSLALLTNWDINISTNWDDVNQNPVTYKQYNGNAFGDLVTFGDFGLNYDGTNSVNLPGRVVPASVTINSTVSPYTLTGPGGIDGTTALVVSNSLSFLLATSNNYTGGTFLNGGVLTITNDSALGANSGLLAMSGGTLQIAGNTVSTRPVVFTTNSTMDIPAGVTAQLTGPITGTGDLILTDYGTLTLSPTGTSSFGNLRVSNGQLNVTAGTVNVRDSQGSATRVENNAAIVVSGGTLNLVGSNVLNGWFPIGVTAGATGAVVVAGGTINVNDHWGTEVGNESGSGVLTINNGTFINNDAGGIGLLLADGSSPGGVINLNGGTLAVNKIGAGAGVGGQFYLNGGTLKPVATISGFWANSAKVSAQVRNGGAVVDTAGFNVTIGQPLLHSTVAGDNATDGGLTKIGNGTLQLTGASTYTGPTVINGGILAGNATLAGALVNNAILTVGSGGAGTLTVNGNITLNAGSTNNFTVNGSTLARTSVAAGAGVTYGGLLNILPGGTFAAGQQFQLFSGNGATNTSNFAGIAGSPGSGLAFSFTNGVLSVISTGSGVFTSAPHLMSFTVNGANVVISGTNGQAGCAYYLLDSTDAGLPLSQWQTVATNVLSASGSFTFIGTNAVTPGNQQQFYILSNTNSNH